MVTLADPKALFVYGPVPRGTELGGRAIVRLWRACYRAHHLTTMMQALVAVRDGLPVPVECRRTFVCIVGQQPESLVDRLAQIVRMADRAWRLYRRYCQETSIE